MMTAPPRKPATVLIVDDEAGLRRVLERYLERHGYRVLSAGTAESAYEILAAETADALLLDIHLPTMSGLALYLAIVSRGFVTVVLAATFVSVLLLITFDFDRPTRGSCFAHFRSLRCGGSPEDVPARRGRLHQSARPPRQPLLPVQDAGTADLFATGRLSRSVPAFVPGGQGRFSRLVRSFQRRDFSTLKAGPPAKRLRFLGTAMANDRSASVLPPLGGPCGGIRSLR